MQGRYPSRREEAIAHDTAVAAVSLAEMKRLDLVAAQGAERRRIMHNEFMDVADQHATRRDLRQADIRRLDHQGGNR